MRPIPHGGTEVDALQADVMRFVAIIGLCLAAIFSLLQEADPTSDTTHPPPGDTAGARTAALPGRQLPNPNADPALVQVAMATAKSAQALEPELELKLEPEPEPEPEPIPMREAENSTPPESPQSPPSPAAATTPPDPKGFTLSFASDEALLRLLATGSATVYAVTGSKFWRYQPGGTLFRQSETPRSYHEMHNATVPDQLQQWMIASGEQVDAWGVVLAPAIAEQLQAYMADTRGGDLVINRSGQVLGPDASVPASAESSFNQ